MTQYPITFPPPEYAAWNLTLDQFGLEEYYEYSTTNVLAMEYLAEEVTGKSMQDLVQDLVLTPLDLKNTAEPPRDAAAGTVVPDPASTSYIGQACVDEFTGTGGVDVALHYRNDDFYDSIVNTGTGGSMFSTIQDLLQWAKSGVGDSLLSPETVTTRHEFKPTNLLISYGLGMHTIQAIPVNEEFGLWYGHNGDAFNSNARATKSDEHGISFASALNSCGSVSTIHDDGMTILVGDYLWYVAPDETDGSAVKPDETDGSTVEPAGSDGATTSTDSAGVMPLSPTTLPLVVAVALLFTY